MMDVKEIAETINKLSEGTKMAGFQDLRKEVKELGRVSDRRIFSDQTIKETYAYHHGGREELQFNIAIDEAQKRFRYGVAFSIEASRSCPDPFPSLKPRIARYNQYVKKFKNQFNSFSLWYRYDNRHSTSDFTKEPAGVYIQEKHMKLGTLIFFGKQLSLVSQSVDEQDCKKILKTFELLLPLYDYVERKTIDTTILKPSIRKHVSTEGTSNVSGKKKIRQQRKNIL